MEEKEIIGYGIKVNLDKVNEIINVYNELNK